MSALDSYDERTWEAVSADIRAAYQAVTEVLAGLDLPREGDELYEVSRYPLGAHHIERRHLVVTRAQARAVEACLREILPDTNPRHVADDEVKQLTWGVGYRGALWLWVVVGLRRDAGTFAETLCRRRLHVVIGSRGGITTWVGRRRVQGRRNLWRGVQR